jgi:hypothetical protein
MASLLLKAVIIDSWTSSRWMPCLCGINTNFLTFYDAYLSFLRSFYAAGVLFV